jgi:hypothetical protein
MNNVNLKKDIAMSTIPSTANPLTKTGPLGNQNRQAIKLIENFFSQQQAIAAKPFFTMQSKMIINVFYYLPIKEQALDNSTVNSLGKVLSKLYKRPVELRLLRLNYPYLNCYTLAQYIAINTGKYNFKAIMNSLFAAVRESIADFSDEESSTSLPSHIIGVKVKISGRLVTQRSVPRQTTQTAQIGSFSSSVVNKANTTSNIQTPTFSKTNIVEHAAFTSKNKKGAFTVKVWISQAPSIIS